LVSTAEVPLLVSSSLDLWAASEIEEEISAMRRRPRKQARRGCDV
jgi:hypothetical protein